MQNEKISLDAMPEMLAAIAQKLESIEAKVDNLTIPSNKEEKDEWLNLKGLCEHLPSHPAEQTVYGWTPSTIPFDYVRKSMLKYEINPLFAFLCGVMGEQETRRIFQLYRVGTGYKWGGCAVFWQTDINGQTRTGKLMAYDRTGHRAKEPTNTVSWSHSELKMTGYHLVQCLFGEHLLPSKPNTPVALVESEKTAVIMTHYMPNLLWLATGGKDGCFNENAMQR